MFKQKIANSVYLVASVCLLITIASNSNAGVNFDTAWTYIYDGGVATRNGITTPIKDAFYDVKSFDDGTIYCVGTTSDSSNYSGTFLVKIDKDGKVLWKKRFSKSGGGHSIVKAKNGDLLIGGAKSGNPLIMRLDTAGNLKWSTWYYDSIKNQSKLYKNATVNSIFETSRGTIICAAGDEYPNNGGMALNNYAAFLELDSTGKLLKGNQWSNITGYTIGGFCIEETDIKNYILSGNQAVFYLDTNGAEIWKKQYTMMLDGVGSEVNNVNKAKMLRDGSLMAIGQAYEGNCWTKYKSLYYDAWWSPISYAYGVNEAWDTLGRQGGDDNIYDFTQLVNGNLVFVGNKDNVSSDSGGIWTFVTDSTGKNVLWEKQFKIKYHTDDGRASLPYSVCATSDNGFTVVGKDVCVDSLGGVNAFAAHFVPQAVSVISQQMNSHLKMNPVNCMITGTNVIFSLPPVVNSPVNLTIYNAAGKMIANQIYSSALKGKIVWDATAAGKGVYFYKVKIDKNIFVGNVVW